VTDGLQTGEEVVVRANFLIDAESNLKAALDTFGGDSGHAGQAKPEAAKPAPAAAGAQAHTGRGTVKSVDMKNGTVEINHGPIASLKWPAMTMEFKAKGKAMLAGVKPGQSVEFDISQRGAGEFVIERIAPAGVAEHKGH
jgi:Cu(I)/Ag(I) efflux system membrane fusion protein